MIKTAIMGYGTIGAGVADVLEINAERIRKATGQEVGLKYILDIREFPGDKNEDKLVHDFSVIEQDPEIDIVVETMGGVHPAYDFVKAALLAGKHVVTSNKALVAAKGTELLAIAREKNINFFFEASVGGGIPLIRPLTHSLMGEEILEISGILNGTTNYILSKMKEEGAEFADALKEAQAKGYAERNPEADIEGFDTCRKIAILTALATGKEVDFEEIPTEGISRITATDLSYARKLGRYLKLFGTSIIEGDKVTAYVAPVLISHDHVLHGVNNVYNGVMVKGATVGTLMFYGSGAGKMPTANAVVSDIVEAVLHMHDNVPLGWSGEKLTLAPLEEHRFAYYVRIAGNTPEMKQAVRDAFGTVQTAELTGLDEFAVVTGEMKEKEFLAKAAGLGEKVLQKIRVIGA